MIKIIKPGSYVRVADDVKAIVLGVLIKEDGITYECAWWSGITRTTAWLSSAEVNAEIVPIMKVGFSGISYESQDTTVKRIGKDGCR